MQTISKFDRVTFRIALILSTILHVTIFNILGYGSDAPDIIQIPITPIALEITIGNAPVTNHDTKKEQNAIKDGSTQESSVLEESAAAESSKITQEKAQASKEQVVIPKEVPKPKEKPHKPLLNALKELAERAHSRNMLKSARIRMAESRSNLLRGSALGNSIDGQDAPENYMQLLSLWIDRHQFYPEEAREQQLSGESLVRVRINRNGHILSYKLEQKTGYPILDRAIFKIIQDSDPVPPFPESWLETEWDFLLPIVFSYKD